ncbi:MAG: glycosyltransferase family 4 protein [Chloroflexota bacterium]
MKILMINSFNYLRGGAERCFLDLTELLEANGHEVIPFCMDHPQNIPSEYVDYFVPYMDFPTELAREGVGPKLAVVERVLYSREARRQLERLIRDTQPDLAHIHGFIHEMSTSILPALKAADIPVVQTLHDYKIVCPNTTFVSGESVCESCMGHRYYNMVRNRCKRDSTMASVLAGVEMYFHEWFRLYEPNIDLFISPSQFLSDKVQEHGVRKPIVTIPNFISPSAFSPNYDKEDYFIYVGRLVRVKGVFTLFEAMRQLPASAKLYIAGRGEVEDELKAFAAEHNLTNIEFLGHLNTDDLTSLMQKASFTVVPSEWYENYSMTVIESLACGTPVVGATIGGIPEQVRNEWNGLLFPSGDADALARSIRFMLKNPSAVREMGRNGREQIDTINSPQYHYDRTLAAYESVLSGEYPDRLFEQDKELSSEGIN